MKKILSTILVFVLTVTFYSMLPVSAVDEAELVLTSVYAEKSNLYDGDATKLSFTVRNIGNEVFNKMVLIDFYCNGQLYETVRETLELYEGEYKNIESVSAKELQFGVSSVRAVLRDTDSEQGSELSSIKKRLTVSDGLREGSSNQYNSANTEKVFGTEENGVKLEIVLDQPSVKQGDLMYVNAVVTNNSGKTIYCSRGSYYDPYDEVDVDIKGPDGKVCFINIDYLPQEPTFSYVVIEPGSL